MQNSSSIQQEQVATTTHHPHPTSKKIVQAAGHGLLRIDPDREGAIIKPTTRQECVCYECFTHDHTHMNTFREQFLPKYHTSWPIMENKYVPGSKFTHEISLQNLCELTDESVFRWEGELNVVGIIDDKSTTTTATSTNKEDDNEEDKSETESAVGSIHIKSAKIENGKHVASFSSSSPRSSPCPPLIHESTPSVLDLKIGRFRHTNSTPLRKYMRMWRKDGPTTSRSVGMRLCGVKHSRFVTNSLLTSLFDDGDADADADVDPNCNVAVEKKKERRRAAIQKRKEKAVKAGESDSEIMQLPRAAEQARKLKNENHPGKQKEGNNNSKNTNSNIAIPQPSSVVLDTLSWTEDKVLGRNATAEELAEVLAMFCTIHVDEQSSKIGRSPVCPEDKYASQRFDPCPEDVLLNYFLERVNKMIEVIERDKILENYSFASTSILFLHRWRIYEKPKNSSSSSSSSSSSGQQVAARENVSSESDERERSIKKSFFIEIEADFRLVDFSSSGPTNEQLKDLGTKFNSSLKTTTTSTSTTSLSSPISSLTTTASPASTLTLEEDSVEVVVDDKINDDVNPFATHQPQKDMVKMFADDAIEFNFGLKNVKALFENLQVVNDILQSRKVQLEN